MITWLTVWLSAGVFAFAVNIYAHCERITGRLGRVVCDAYRRQVMIMGGAWPLFWVIVLTSFLLPPVALVGCVVSYRKDWAIYQLEDESPP